MQKFIQRNIHAFIRFYPPLMGAGIKVSRISADCREIDVEMNLRFWNANYVGTHYGGSLYSMTDPFYMLMLIENLGREYIVWDKAASIRFRKPGRGKVTAQFRITEEQLDETRRTLESQEKLEPVFTVEIKDESGDVVAEVQKTLYVRKKNPATT
jgi:acyl-coenzyme A thioesterase PaaI-like protein